MNVKITERFDVLLKEGEALVNALPPLVKPTDQYGGTKTIPGRLASYVNEYEIPRYQSWLSSAANLLHQVAGPGSYFAKTCDELTHDKRMENGVHSEVVQKMFALLKAAKEDADYGLLGKIEFNIAGATFDDFLDHAEEYHKGNKKMESSVLASAVLEDTVKKICNKNSINPSGKRLDDLVTQLVQTDILTRVKAKRVRSFAGVRNHALHAEWDEFDISDVGAMIKGVRELIEEFL